VTDDPATTTVLLVDDHPLFLDGVRAALDGTAGLLVVGEAHSCAEALDQAAALSPDVVLMDLNLPDGSGIDATRQILAGAPGTRILVITMSAEDDAVVAAMRAGARGYVVKGSGRADLIRAVTAVAAGGAVFSPAVAERLGSFFSGMAAQPGREMFPQLSDRERQVLDLVARGHDNRRIARELFLSEKTVRNQVSLLIGKLGVADRAEAIARARRAGLGQEPAT
jgi:DNA-binding NarL/FixJ family response regulator